MPERLSMEALTELFPKLTPAMLLSCEYPETGEQALKRAGETAKLLADEFQKISYWWVTVHQYWVPIGLVGGIAKTEVKASCAAW